MSCHSTAAASTKLQDTMFFPQQVVRGSEWQNTNWPSRLCRLLVSCAANAASQHLGIASRTYAAAQLSAWCLGRFGGWLWCRRSVGTPGSMLCSPRGHVADQQLVKVWH